MDSTEYRARAERLLTSQHPLDLNPAVIEQAAVWAALAQAAATVETAKQEQESTR